MNHPAAKRTLRLAWNVPCATSGDDFNDELKLTDFDKGIWRHFEITSDNILIMLQKAKNHDLFEAGIIAANNLLSICPKQFGLKPNDEILGEFDKFFDTRPNQVNDEKLLLDILNFCNNILEQKAAGKTFLNWISQKLENSNCPLYEYISTGSSRDSKLKRSIIRGVYILVEFLLYFAMKKWEVGKSQLLI
jgi:hypothetical protein